MRLYHCELFLLLLLIQLAQCLRPRFQLDWCLYWRFLNKDQFRPECNGVYRLRFAKHKVHDQRRDKTQTTNTFSRLSSSGPVSSWNSLDNKNQVLTNRLTIPTLGVPFGKCNSSQPSNCQMSSSCPSGQLCVDSSGYCCGRPRIVTSCPAPDTLVPKCAPQRNQINWCVSNAECAPHLAPRDNSIFNSDAYLLDSLNRYPSLCCPTQCGYNMCIR